MSLRNGALIPLAAAVLVAGGCSEKPREERSQKSDSVAIRAEPVRVDTSKRVSRDLPSGRFELPTTHTPAPDLWITLPAGYTVKDAGKLPDDRLFVVRLDDPSASDTTKVTPGFMRIYIGPRPQHPFGTAPAREGRHVIVAGQPVAWRELEDALPDGRRYLKRELVVPGMFASISPELAKLPLHFHIYVAGADSARVAELMRAAETIGFAP